MRELVGALLSITGPPIRFLVMVALVLSPALAVAQAQPSETLPSLLIPIEPPDKLPDSGTQGGYLFNLRPLGADLGRKLADDGVYLVGRGLYEGLGNVSGGVKRGVFAEGFTAFGVDLDLDRIAGIKGGVFHFLVSDLTGQSFAAYSGSSYLNNRIFAGNGPGLHQNEFNYEQILFNGRLDLRVGRVDVIRAACVRGVSFDLIWGAETPQPDEDNRNGAAAVEIARIIREDRDLARHFRIHMRTTGSHAKILLTDTRDGDWIAAVGSCNWVSTPFRATELTAVLRDQHIVADVAEALQRMVGRRGLSDDIATEMSIVAGELRRRRPAPGPARISLLLGESHDTLMRTASGSAQRRMIVGSHRLGSTARPGVVMQGEAAAGRGAAEVALLYTMPSGPLKKRHARKLAEEAAEQGVRLLRVEPPLHGKFLAWDDEDLAITSLNWASAASDLDFPQADIGVHIHAQGIANNAIERLEAIYPELKPANGPPRSLQAEPPII